MRINRIPLRRLVPLFATAFALLALQATAAQDFEFEPVAPRIVSARLAGFGGSYCALEAGIDTLSTNPAALSYTKPEWSFARVAMHVSGPLFDLPSVFKSDDETDALLDLVEENNGVYIGADMTGPLAVARVDRNFGFGVFNRTLSVSDIPSLTRATIYVGEEFLLVGGYGLTVWDKGPHAISVGLQLKGFFQVFVTETGTSVSVVNTLTDLDIDGLPSVLSTGFGIDAGVLYRLGKRFDAALVCRDLYTPVFSTQYDGINGFIDGDSTSDTNYDRLPIDLTVGVAYSIPLPEHWSTVSSWRVMFDYRDILAFTDPVYRNPVLNVAFGTELVLLDVVSLRVGISDSYLSGGIGLDLTVCNIDLAMYGSELGLEPGRRPLLNMALSVAFEY